MKEEKIDFRNPAMICTFFRMASSPITCILLFTGILHTFTFILKIAESASDILDGFLAKNFGYATNWGRTLDPPADKMSNISSLVFILFATQDWLPYLRMEFPVVDPLYLRLLIISEFLLLGLGCLAKYCSYPIKPNLAGKVKMVGECLFINIWLLFALRPWGFIPPSTWIPYTNEILVLTAYLAFGSILWHAVEWCLEAEETDEEIWERKSVRPNQEPAKWVIALGAFLNGLFERVILSLIENSAGTPNPVYVRMDFLRLKPPPRNLDRGKSLKRLVRKCPR